jgi:hypothetical protein
MQNNTMGSDIPEEEAPGESKIERLLHQSEYTPTELAELIDVPLSLIEREAFAGRLRASIVDHHVVAIRQQDAIDWMANRS